MKRLLVPFVIAAFVAAPASAASKPKPKPKPKPPKPVTMTHYLHGASQFGEMDQSFFSDGPMTMDAAKPTGTQAKSKQVTNYVAGPNTECTGNAFFPFWDGAVTGTLSGKATVTLYTTAAPGSQILVRLFNSPNGDCNDGYEMPIAEKTVPVPQGEGKVVVPMDVKRTAKPIKGVLRLMVSFTGNLGDTGQTRVYYDATSVASSVTFSCLPKPGKKTC